MIRIMESEDWPTYLVQIDQDVYEMSQDANMPNGVCIYVGNIDIDRETIEHFSTGTICEEIPLGIVKQIVNIVSRF